MIDLSYENRFGGLERLLGSGALSLLRKARVMVIGLGGVGSWTVEALARSGVGQLTLVDLDDICATNTNRQLPASDPNWGRLKVDVLKDRVLAINPEAVVQSEADFFTAASAQRLLAQPVDFVIDAMDSVADKAYLIAFCRQQSLPLILSGGAGGKTDPTQIRVTDLANVQGDSLLKAVKRRLKEQTVEPLSDKTWGVEAVWSLQPSILPWEVCSTVASPQAGGSTRIDCAQGFGAASFATGAFGFALASRVVLRLCSKKD